MQRVQRKQRRDHSAPPHRAGHPPEQEKQQERIGDVEQQARQVMPPGFIP